MILHFKLRVRQWADLVNPCMTNIVVHLQVPHDGAVQLILYQKLHGLQLPAAHTQTTVVDCPRWSTGQYAL